MCSVSVSAGEFAVVENDGDARCEPCGVCGRETASGIAREWGGTGGVGVCVRVCVLCGVGDSGSDVTSAPSSKSISSLSSSLLSNGHTGPRRSNSGAKRSAEAAEE